MRWFAKRFLKWGRKVSDKARAEVVVKRAEGLTEGEAKQVDYLIARLDNQLDVIEGTLNAKV